MTSGPRDASDENAEFVREHTRLGAAAFVPEVRLHLADEAMDLWERTEQARGETQLAPPFWGFAWAGGLALARYVLDTPTAVAGRSVLDLATGCGLVAIAAAVAGASSVTACDVDELAAAAARLNAAANGVRVEVLTADLLPVADRDAGVFSRMAPGMPDVEVVLAGDVFYDRAMAARALAFLAAAADRGALVLVGDPGRKYLPRERMTALATYDVPVDAELEDQPVKRTTVWRLDVAAGAWDDRRTETA